MEALNLQSIIKNTVREYRLQMRMKRLYRRTRRNQAVGSDEHVRTASCVPKRLFDQAYKAYLGVIEQGERLNQIEARLEKLEGPADPPKAGPSRAMGFYWVRTRENRDAWRVGNWDGGYWLLPGDSRVFGDLDFIWIGRDRLPPPPFEIPLHCVGKK